jgi:cell division protein FtsQ
MNIHPKRIRWIVKRLLWVFGALVLILFILGAIEYKRKSLVNELTIKIIVDQNGNKFVDQEDVKSILFNNFGHHIEGQTIEKINARQTEEALEKDLFIKDADVYIDALNNVNITVRQREPILRIMDSYDISYYLDEDGKMIPHTTKYTSRTLVATGLIDSFKSNYLEIPQNRLNQIFKLSKKIIENPFLKAQIEQIHMEESGEVTLIPKLGNHKILFGYPAENLSDKLFRLQVFYEKGLPYEGWEKYKTINLAFKNQVVVKKRIEEETDKVKKEKNDNLNNNTVQSLN